MTVAKALPSILTQEMVKRVLRYEPETGALYWLSRPSSMFPPSIHPPESRAARWNKKYAGQPAFTSKDDGGYLHGAIFYEKMKAHRVIWLYMTGDLPEEIDHINGDRSDNRWSNLRAATRTDNARNMKLKASNKTGAPGVSLLANGKFAVTIGVDGQSVYLGTFDTFDQAKRERQLAQDAYGYHANHGRKAVA